MIRRIGLACLIAGLLAPALRAQSIGLPQTITVVDSGTACVTAPTACATFSVGNAGSAAIDISGTWTGTFTFEATANGDTWRSILVTNTTTGALSTTTTASGTFALSNAGYQSVRVRATATVTGTAFVTGTRGYLSAKLQMFTLGSGSNTYAPEGVICRVTAAVSNSGTGETDLMSCTLSAASLSVNGQGVRITAWGTTAANGNTKAMRLYFGTATPASRTGVTTSGVSWKLQTTVLRTGAATQVAQGEAGVDNVSVFYFATSPTQDLTAAITIKVTGQSGTGSNDVTATGLLVEALP